MKEKISYLLKGLEIMAKILSILIQNNIKSNDATKQDLLIPILCKGQLAEFLLDLSSHGSMSCSKVVGQVCPTPKFFKIMLQLVLKILKLFGNTVKILKCYK